MDFYVGQLLCVAFPQTPRGCVECKGQLLNIQEFPYLFEILKTTYGGDGVTTFGVPDIQGRALMGADATHPVGTRGGEASHTLTREELPPHKHEVNAVTAPGTQAAANGQFATAPMYASGAPSVPMHDGAVGTTGGNTAHENRQPFLTMRWVMVAFGVIADRASYYLGSIFPMTTDWVPRESMRCEGQILQIKDNVALFSLLSNTFGGDGQQTFALPDLRGKVVVGIGHGAALSEYTLAQTGGSATVHLGAQNLPNHTHPLFAAGGRGFTWGSYPANNYLSDAQPNYADAAAKPSGQLHVDTIGLTGGQNPHNNLMPFFAVNWCMTVVGLFPQRP